MGVEHEIETRKDIFKKTVAEYAVDHADPVFRYGVERVIEASPITYPQGFAKDYKDAIVNGYFPILIPSHQSHFDALLISKATRDLTYTANSVLLEDKKLEGFIMPIASTVGSGQQDALLKIMYKKIGSILNTNKIMPVDMPRLKDFQKYGTPLEKRKFVKEMLTRLHEGYQGIMVFPEGTVESGRNGPNGKPNGMQPFIEGSLATFTNFAQHTGKKALYIPVGIDGGRNILSGNRRPPFTALALGFLSPHPSLAFTNVGMPIRADDEQIRNLTNGDRDQFLGRKIAELLPPNMRGAYA